MEINDFSKKYFNDFNSFTNQIEASGIDGQQMEYAEALAKAVALLVNVQKENKKVMMVGNGGSAGICSHMTVDYWKNGGIKATAFNDSSLLTCISNDFSYAEVFSKPIEMFAEKNDIAYCISSSGQSPNILNAAKAAKTKGCTVFTFSGFKPNNPLRSSGNLNFFVPSFSYGFVEILHLFIIHSLLDAKLYCTDHVDIFNKNIHLS